MVYFVIFILAPALILAVLLAVPNTYGLKLTKFLLGRKTESKHWVILTHKSYEAAVKGEYWESIYLAQKALELNPRASEAWRLIGNAYEFLGDESEESDQLGQAAEFHKNATQAWDKAKEINPNTIIPGYHE